MEKQLTAMSPFNEYPEVTKDISFNKNLTLCDCTLRDGEQMAGIVLRKQEKVEIGQKLDAMRIPEIEAGMPCNSEEDAEAIAEITKTCHNSRITACIRGIEEDFDLAKRIGVWGVTISLPIGVLQRKYKLKWDDQTYLDNMKRLTEYGKKLGLYINLSPYDTTRADPAFMDRVMREVVSCGTVDRVRLVDTTGAASPEAIRYVSRRIKNILGDKVWLEVHCHNDFGLGVASTIAGAMGGAEVLSTTINGIGERAGNTSTEETLMALKYYYGKDLGVDLTQLLGVSQMVEKYTGVTLQKNKAVVGRNAFGHEAGMVVAGVLQCPFVAEAYAPELVGQTRSILIGKKSGAKSIEAKLQQMGVDFPAERMGELVTAVKDKALELKRSLEDDEFLALTKQF